MPFNEGEGGGGGRWTCLPLQKRDRGDAFEGKGRRSGPRSGQTGAKRLGVVTVGYKCRWGWHLASVGQWLGIGWAANLTHCSPHPPHATNRQHPWSFTAFQPTLASATRLA